MTIIAIRRVDTVIYGNNILEKCCSIAFIAKEKPCVGGCVDGFVGDQTINNIYIYIITHGHDSVVSVVSKQNCKIPCNNNANDEIV